ncbi:MaoC family dehydratase [Salinarimonas rosea]|uniref:MaoC family dehydratase n=1 Tax=Salinarimonas rosea TaxID=552063 RepID=UPI00041907C4|nr:MaoC family dehydratase [Salinarimonas rosea]
MKTNAGRFFEDFSLGETIRHATPRTLTVGDQALYTALYGSRFAVSSSEHFARSIGYDRAPLDDLLVFHTVFGKTVPDVSLNAVANLGYAEGRFLAPVYPGDTLWAVSEVIGLKQSSNGETGIVWVRTTGFNQDGARVLSYCRWVLVRKRDPASPAPEPHVPTLAPVVAADEIARHAPALTIDSYDFDLAGAADRFGDYSDGERIDHVDAMTVEEAEHQLATRLYQNTARVHFDRMAAEKSRFGKRLIYGGHVISLARALSFNGLANAFTVAAVNAGRHVAPLFAGDTVSAWSEVLATCPLAGRDDVGALRLRTVAVKNRPSGDFAGREGEGYAEGVILDLDYWVLIPR